LKKRTKKLLTMAYAAGDSATASQKSFASFLQKRRPFFLIMARKRFGTAQALDGGGMKGCNDDHETPRPRRMDVAFP
jgi:hypothetical protein